jgi:hypothetical protein
MGGDCFKTRRRFFTIVEPNTKNPDKFSSIGISTFKGIYITDKFGKLFLSYRTSRTHQGCLASRQ